MRRLPRPLIGAAVTIAVAASAILVGMRFASPEAAAAVATEDVPVLAPVSVGDAPATPDNDPETLDVSDATGTARIVPPGNYDEDALPPGVADAIAALDESGGDPADTHLALGGADDGTDDGTGDGGDGAADDSAAGDPCSPAPGEAGEGDAPEGCPDGLHSAIFADTMPEDLEVWPVPDPSTTLEGTSIYCPDLAPGDGELGLGVGTNLPATITARYWPIADPTAVQTLTLEGIPAEEAAWQAEIAATGDYTRGMYVFQHCGMMTGLTPNTDYMVSAYGIDTYMRISAPVERRFNSAGQPTIPPMTATPLGSSLLYVSVPNYGATNVPLLQAWVVEEGTVPGCSAADTAHQNLRIVGTQHLVEVSADYLRRHNYVSGYNTRLVSLYDVPEGSTVVLCARWYDREAPSWARDTPTDQKAMVVMSPDTISPIVTLARLNLANAVTADAVRMTASSQWGWVCGEASAPGADASAGAVVEVGAELCRISEAGTTRIAEGGTRANVVISTDLVWGSRHTTSRAMLPLGRLACVGVCELPEPRTYIVALPTVTVGAGMCGSSFGDCTPPTRETAFGTADVVVTWEQGNANGLDRWSVGAVDDTPPDAPVSDRPQFDAGSYWVPSLSPDGWTGSATLTFRTDRHVSYTIWGSGDCVIGTSPGPLTGVTRPTDVGVESATVSISGVCPGESYDTQVEIVDDAGRRTVAAYTASADTIWWPGARFTVPINEIEVTGTMTVTTFGGWNESWWLVGSDVYFGADERRLYADYGASDARCYTGAVDSATGPLRTVRVNQERTIHVRAYTRVTSESLYYGVDHDARCDWPDPNNWVADVEFDVPFDQLLRGVTVTGDLWQRGFPEGRPGEGRIRYSLTLTATRVTR